MPQGWEMMPWYGMIFGPIMMIMMVAIMVTVIVLIVRWFGGGFSSRSGPYLPFQGTQYTALDILKERFAKGEIDKDEFEERRSVLGS